MRVFLAYHYDEHGKAVARLFDALLDSHGVEIETGENTGGGALDVKVAKKIEGCDGLVALFTKRQRPESTNNWVHHEFAHAQATIRRVFAVYERGVPTDGMYSGHERVEFEGDEGLVEAILKVSSTIGVWRREIGDVRAAFVVPDEVCQKVRRDSYATCEYQRMDPSSGDVSGWSKTDLQPLGLGGYRVTVGQVRRGDLIQLRITSPEGRWESGFTDQAMRLEMKEL